MLISTQAVSLLQKNLQESQEVFCSGLFLSARWMVLSQCARNHTQLIVLPNRESAEYCAADLYNCVKGDCIFYLPESGKAVERSNYKSSLGVQRTTAVSKLLENSGLNFIVTYPAALEEKIPDCGQLKEGRFSLRSGDQLPYEELRRKLLELGFEKVDFVSAPGQFAIRGAIIDIFSFSLERPYRVSYSGNEIDAIHSFDGPQGSHCKAEQSDHPLSE